LSSGPEGFSPASRLAPFAAALALAAAFFPACGGGREVETTIQRYTEAVQQRDVALLWAMRSGTQGQSGESAIPEAFEREANDYYSAYEIGKRAGEIRFDPWGVAAVRALALGKGAYYEILDVESPQEEARLVRVKVPLPYEHIDNSAYPRDTVLYFLQSPLGKIHKHTVGVSPFPFEQELLSEIVLRWTLVADRNSPPLSPAGWQVLTLLPEPESAVFRPMKIGGAKAALRAPVPPQEP
jgi:hypothetical protein